MLDAVFLREQLPADIEVQTAVFGLPRGGNQAWADFVDATVRLLPLRLYCLLSNVLCTLLARLDPVTSVKPERPRPELASPVPRLPAFGG